MRAVTAAEVTSCLWQYYHEYNPSDANTLSLSPNGKIERYQHPNEVSWNIVDGVLCFYDEQGGRTVAFQAREDGRRLRLRGPYTGNPLIVLCLDQDDPEVGISAHPVALGDLAVSQTIVAEALHRPLPCALVMTNHDKGDPVFAAHMRNAVYLARTAELSPLILVGLPSNTVVYGGGHFVTTAGGRLILEQFPPYIGTVVPSLAAITAPGPADGRCRRRAPADRPLRYANMGSLARRTPSQNYACRGCVSR